MTGLITLAVVMSVLAALGWFRSWCADDQVASLLAERSDLVSENRRLRARVLPDIPVCDQMLGTALNDGPVPA